MFQRDYQTIFYIYHYVGAKVLIGAATAAGGYLLIRKNKSQAQPVIPSERSYSGLNANTAHAIMGSVPKGSYAVAAGAPSVAQIGMPDLVEETAAIAPAPSAPLSRATNTSSGSRPSPSSSFAANLNPPQHKATDYAVLAGAPSAAAIDLPTPSDDAAPITGPRSNKWTVTKSGSKGAATATPTANEYTVMAGAPSAASIGLPAVPVEPQPAGTQVTKTYGGPEGPGLLERLSETAAAAKQQAVVS
jgi:hypothetical protein